ncbi:MAG: TonB-dependent receptor, partial [Gemmatimonadaceae bacterium]|nr:TonB-dependent receptor [Chitinophagaceae bacterium]
AFFETNKGNYYASSGIGAAYVAMINHLTKKLQLNWGLRLESANQTSSTVQYEYAPGYRNPQLFTIDDNTKQVQFNLLPSATLDYHFAKWIAFGVSYARTVSRPMLQEMNAYRYYDAENFMVKGGNTFLGAALINNLNVNLNILQGKSGYFNLTGFYKDIDQPIEEVLSGYSSGILLSTPYNMPKAKISGVSSSLRLSLAPASRKIFLSSVSVVASATFTNSEVDAGPLRSSVISQTASHTLSGTPYYMYSAGLVVQDKRFPELSVIYNHTGDYISMVGSGAIIEMPGAKPVSTIADYRVKDRGQLNVQIAQSFLKMRMQLIAGVSNLLNESFIRYQDLNGNGKFDSPLILSSGNPAGSYISGTDNTVSRIKAQPLYYFRLSYSFQSNK